MQYHVLLYTFGTHGVSTWTSSAYTVSYVDSQYYVARKASYFYQLNWILGFVKNLFKGTNSFKAELY